MAWAKKGTEQLPVKIAEPVYDTVVIWALVYVACVTISVELADVLVEVEEVAVDAALELLSAVVPKGEHPTKFGAVELTAAHSCMLN